jgi:hypothetical protein
MHLGPSLTAIVPEASLEFAEQGAATRFGQRRSSTVELRITDPGLSTAVPRVKTCDLVYAQHKKQLRALFFVELKATDTRRSRGSACKQLASSIGIVRADVAAHPDRPRQAVAILTTTSSAPGDRTTLKREFLRDTGLVIEVLPGTRAAPADIATTCASLSAFCP